MLQSSYRNFARSIKIPHLGPDGSKQTGIEVLSGLTVALALVPEAIAFAFVARVDPLVGLYAAFFVGLITAILGGRPGMISGATGALAVVMVELTMHYDVGYLFATVILMGILQILAGIFRLGKFIRMVPHPVMLGFVNGLAVVIFLSQLEQFKIADASGHETWMSGPSLVISLALVALTMFLIWGTPKVTKAVPAPLVAIVAVALIAIGLDLPVPRVIDKSSVAGGLPQFAIPTVPITWETLTIILPYAIILGAIGLIESLLTLNLVGEITNQRGGASKECVAQGTANVVTGFFGGMGGCAMIGQSMINISSGARHRLSGISAALFLLAFILFASPLIDQIPLAALIGVMFMVVIGTFAWNSIALMRRVPKSDALVIIIVTIVTVFQDLAVAVVVGVIVSALVYAWNAASTISVETHPSVRQPGAKVYEIKGPLFFGSATRFEELFEPKGDVEDEIILDFSQSRVVDQSALQAIEKVASRYEKAGKRLMLRHLSRDCHKLLNNAGQLMIDSDDDPDYSIAADYDIQTGRIGSH